MTRKVVFTEKTRETGKVAEDTGATAAEYATAEATIGAAVEQQPMQPEQHLQ